MFIIKNKKTKANSLKEMMENSNYNEYNLDDYSITT